MKVALFKQQERFMDNQERIYCQWFDRGEGATTAIVLDALIKSFEDNGNSYIFCDNRFHIKLTKDLIQSYAGQLRVDFTYMFAPSFSECSAVNNQTGNVIMSLPKDVLRNLRFCANVRVNYIYVDDYNFDIDKEDNRWLLSKSLKQLKIAGKY